MAPRGRQFGGDVTAALYRAPALLPRQLLELTDDLLEVGEIRIHYAGFFDPGFGYGLDQGKGTHAVLEVRSHEVPFVMEDGQVVGRLVFERLTEFPQKIYGANIGSSYQAQGLSLSKQFKRRLPSSS